MVGTTGIEPVTPTMSTKRLGPKTHSNQCVMGSTSGEHRQTG